MIYLHTSAVVKLVVPEAIHLASAHALRSALTAVVAYDERMIAGGRALGLPVESPS